MMHRVLRLRPSPGLAVAFLALLLASGGAAWASTSVTHSNGGSHVIHACVQPYEPGDAAHELSLPAAGQGCPKGDRPISWNEKGQRGAPGSRGPAGARGKSGANGAQGPVGTAGPQGAPGTNGANGTDGTNGTNGASVLHGEGPPSASTGNEGDFYIDTTEHKLYGPKAKGSWAEATPASLVGPQGEKGATGAQGPQGEKGATGAQGPQGEKGATGAVGAEGKEGKEGKQGPAGVSGYEVVRESQSVTLQNGETHDVDLDARCASGKKLLGGGISGDSVDGDIYEDGPTVIGGTVYDIWEAAMAAHDESGGEEKGEVSVVAYCANVE